MQQALIEYIRKSPDCFHAVANVEAMLKEAGYVSLNGSNWKLDAGGKYYLTANSSSLIAFRMPESAASGFMLAASHSDSPCFRLRQHPETGSGDYLRLEAERYGGMLNAPWLDRPLSVAGRVIVRTPQGVEERLVDFEKDMLVIPNVAIHMNRDANNSYKLDPARDLQPLYAGKNAAGSFERDLAALAGCEKKDLLSGDLYVYNSQPGMVWGPQGEFISAPRLDDLGCVFTSTIAFLRAGAAASVPVLCIFDNEEIGSETKQGAASALLRDVLERIAAAQGQDIQAMLDNSFLLSCDNGHARHPNHPEYADPVEAPVMNGGVVIKHSPRYATDAVADALFSEICRRSGAAVQYYSNRPDLAGGSTLGNIANTKVPVRTVDIGMAQLAMHSCYETAGSRDVDAMICAIRGFYETALRCEGGRITIL